MLIRDIMTTKVITISPGDHIMDARRIMETRRFRRLPVVEDGKLVGIVTWRRLESSATAAAATNVWEIAYHLGSIMRIKIRDIMQTEVATATPEMTVEAALALAQSKKVGALVVVDESRKVVGIVTTNDVFRRIVNPVLGVGEAGERVWIGGGGEGRDLEGIIPMVNRHCAEIITLHIIKAPSATKKDLVIHIRCERIEKLLAELEEKGYQASIRQR